MSIKIIGAGLPRTGTSSLGLALQHLIGGPVYSMSVIPGHPFDLGSEWEKAFAGKPVAWERMFSGYVAALDWPASMFWQEIMRAFPDVPIILSTRDNSQIWWQSCEATFLPFARLALSPSWEHGRGLVDLLERFTATEHWDDPQTLMSAYERHNAEVRALAPPDRFLEWNPSHGWAPICKLLDCSVPDIPFPWINKRSEWNN